MNGSRWLRSGGRGVLASALLFAVTATSVGASSGVPVASVLPTVADTGLASAQGINDVGVVVGYRYTAVFSAEFAEVWRDGAATDLPGVGGNRAEARAINNRGTIVGTARGLARVNLRLAWRAVQWVNGTVSVLPDLGGTYTEAAGVNNHGQIVGTSDTTGSNSLVGRGTHHAVTWYRGQLTDLGTLGGKSSVGFAINERGVVAGASYTSTGNVHAAMWDQGVAVDLPPVGAGWNVGYAINESGTVVGFSEKVAGTPYTHAVAWIRGRAVDLGTLGGAFVQSQATGINNEGIIVGVSYSADFSQQHAVEWIDGRIIDLGFPAGETLSVANGINDNGTVVGFSDQYALQWSTRSGEDGSDSGFQDNGSDLRKGSFHVELKQRGNPVEEMAGDS